MPPCCARLSLALVLITVAPVGACVTSLGHRGPSSDAAPDAGRPGEVAPDASASSHDAHSADAGARDASDAGSMERAPDARALDASLPSTEADAATVVPDAWARDAATSPSCDPLVFSFGAPFTATEAEPIRRTDFDLDDGLVFGRIDVELDFVRGPWAESHPSGRLGMHNVFWLHRGLRGQDWLDNSVGYLNFTAATQLRLETNLGITDASVWSDVLAPSGCATTEGLRYHVHYSYDAEHRRWWVELTDASGAVVCAREDVPILGEVAGRSPYPRGTSAFFMELGHIPWTPEHEGPEVATLGWTYSEAVVRFYPLGSSCP